MLAGLQLWNREKGFKFTPLPHRNKPKLLKNNNMRKNHPRPSLIAKEPPFQDWQDSSFQGTMAFPSLLFYGTPDLSPS